jgi:hypothetical protein
MNMFQLQERIKDFSKDQLVREMQQPSGAVPPFLVLSELQRRTRMEKAFQAEQAQGQQSTVAQDAIAAAGVPQGGIADMAQAMAPQTDMTGNTGAMPVQNMYGGGEVKRMEPGGEVEGPNTAALRQFMEISRTLSEMQARSAIMQEQLRRRNAAAADRFSFLDADLPVVDEFSGLPSYMTEPGTLADIEPTIDTSEGYDDFDYQRALDEAARMRELNAIPLSTLSLSPTASEADKDRMMEINEIPGVRKVIDGSPYTEALRSDIERQRRRLTPADYQSLGETDPLDPRSPSYVPPFDTSGAYANLLGAPSTIEAMFGDVGPLQGPVQPEPRVPASVEDAARMIELNAVPFAGGEYVPPPSNRDAVADQFEAEAFADDFIRAQLPLPGQTSGRPENIFAPMTEAIERSFTETRLTPDAETPRPVPRPDRSTTPPAGGGGAGRRATSTADADKWLALAQFGLGLMASQQPTLGGAIGEAGTAALSQLRESQKEAYERDLAERTLAARSARDRDGLSASNLISIRSDLIEQYNNLTDGLGGEPTAADLEAAKQIKNQLAGVDRLLGLDALGGLGAVSADSSTYRLPSATQ